VTKNKGHVLGWLLPEGKKMSKILGIIRHYSMRSGKREGEACKRPDSKNPGDKRRGIREKQVKEDGKIWLERMINPFILLNGKAGKGLRQNT